MSAAGPHTSMRERFREQVREDVKAAALEQLAAGGAHAISLNAIAKQLGVSGSALYRYFANRDDLLTALVIDAYHDLRDALAREVDTGKPATGAEERIRRVGRAYRAWALAEPHRYELLFKPPLPGYDAHTEPLAGAARSLMAIVLGVLHDLDSAEAPAERPVPYPHEEVLAARSAGNSQFQLAVSLWSRLHGVVSLELGGGFAAMNLDADAIFENEIRVLLERLDRVTH
ncbi:TetR/AcrR family transcriptional regulator [Sinosporangium siamense]|uniref:TetR family transcriptional regulator n=1 Tax=Sinosporangium siamense TaxID=1367973 RepID=A0A919RN15_9ACTN|nr:TetR/AcrR family transcriptional regulator [Sinosporangium siamense]GII96775.1 TetR family transcriptional regulator [Sinosporangium siamense]